MPDVSSDPYSRVGAVDANYAAAVASNTSDYLFKGAQFSNFNSADRLGGFFINTLTAIHAKVEVPSLRARLHTPIAKATVDSYIDHLKADGDGLLAAIGSLRTANKGSNRAAYANELSHACGHYNALATTANFNFAFVHSSAKQTLYTAGYHNQQTDFWQGSSKFFWFRAEKHFQIQAATASRYITESVEDIYKLQSEISVDRTTQISKWLVTGQAEDLLNGTPASGKLDINLPETIRMSAKDLYIEALESALVKANNLYLQAQDDLQVTCSNAVTISGSQIFLNSGAFGSLLDESPAQQTIPDRTAEDPSPVKIAAIETLPPYARSTLPANQPYPIVAIGTTILAQPPI